MAGNLFVVATPIGNLNDLSDRAKETLREVDGIFCEDTRQSGKLLQHLDIKKPLQRMDAEKEYGDLGTALRRIEEGENWAFLTDAGTPVVSDPGGRFVSAALEKNINVIPIPGPSAVTTLLSASGFDAKKWSFYGFFPRKAGPGLTQLEESATGGKGSLHIWFESPHRIEKTLQLVAKYFESKDESKDETKDEANKETNKETKGEANKETGGAVQVVAAKELTKIYEKFFRGSASSVAQKVSDEISKEGNRGEWIFAVFLMQELKNKKSDDWMTLTELLVTQTDLSAQEISTKLGQIFGVSKKEIYEKTLIFKEKKKSLSRT